MLVYLVTNLITGKRYVGITSKKTAEERWRAHLRAVKQGANFPLQNAIRKYGAKNFGIEILEKGLPNWAALCQREKEFISIMGTRTPFGYNATDGGDGVVGRFRTPAEREAIRRHHCAPAYLEALRARTTSPAWKADVVARRFRQSAAARKAGIARGQKVTEAYRLAVGLKSKLLWQDPAYLEKMAKRKSGRPRKT